MNIKTIGFLVLALAVLGGLAYWDEQETEREEAETKLKNLLVSVDTSKVTKIAYTGAKPGTESEDRVQFVVEKKGDDWQLTQPVTAAADAEQVSNFVKTIAEYKFTSKVAEGAERYAEFGVGEDATKVEIWQEGVDGSVSVTIGKKAPVGYNLYSRVSRDGSATDAIYVGSQYLDTAANKKVNDLRDRSIAKLDELQLDQIEYHMRLQDSITLVRTDKGEYQLSGKPELRIDKATVSTMVNALNSAKAVEFADAPLGEDLVAKLAREEAAYYFSWKHKDGSTGTLHLGRKDGKIWASISGKGDEVAYQMNDEFESSIRKTAEDFRDHRIFTFAASEASKIEVNSETFVKAGQGWYKAEDAKSLSTANQDKAGVESKDGKEGETSVTPIDGVASLIGDLEYARTSAFIKPDATKYADLLVKAPTHRINLVVSDSNITLDLWDSKDDDSYLLKLSTEADELYLIPKSTIDSHDLSGNASTGESDFSDKTALEEKAEDKG